MNLKVLERNGSNWLGNACHSDRLAAVNITWEDEPGLADIGEGINYVFSLGGRRLITRNSVCGRTGATLTFGCAQRGRATLWKAVELIGIGADHIVSRLLGNSGELSLDLQKALSFSGWADR